MIMSSKKEGNKRFFPRNHKGISDIIITVIMVGLVLVAIGVVWFVINNLIGQGTKNIATTEKCLNILVEATSANCANPASCTVVLERTGTGTDPIAGVKLVFKNASASGPVIDSSGNIELLAGKTITVNNTISAPNQIGVTVYFKDNAGKEDFCTQTNVFNF